MHVGYSDLSVIRYLVEHAGADVEARDKGGLSPLRFCFLMGQSDDDCILYLACRTQPDTDVLKPAWMRDRSWVCKKALVENYARSKLQLDGSYISTFPLHVALQTPLPNKKAYSECIDKLSSCDPPSAISVLDPDGRLPLHIALVSKTIKVTAVLLQLWGKEPKSATVRDSVTGLYPFEAAALRSSSTVVSKDGDDCFELGLVYELFRYNPEHFLATRWLGLDNETQSERHV